MRIHADVAQAQTHSRLLHFTRFFFNVSFMVTLGIARVSRDLDVALCRSAGLSNVATESGAVTRVILCFSAAHRWTATGLVQFGQNLVGRTRLL